MAGQKFLFKNFLADPKVYALNQGYWATQIRAWLPDAAVERENLYQTHFANGKKMHDGNPMYSALLKNGKAVRIIQEEPESKQPEIGAWLNQTEINGKIIQEFVISTELTQITKQVVIALITEWSKPNNEVFEVERYISEQLEILRLTAASPSVLRARKTISGQYKDKAVRLNYSDRQKTAKTQESTEESESPEKPKRFKKITI